jgi:peptidyl-prolyl cis-trans isomerase A (cyclophilin A)
MRFIVCALVCSLAGSLAGAADNALPPAAQTPLQGQAAPSVQQPPAPVMATVTVELDGRQVSAEIEDPANPLVVISTTRGDFLLELLPAAAPETVANFLGLAEGTKPFTDAFTGQPDLRPYYDGLIFHRVIDGFMIQAGSPDATPNGGPGYTFNDEINALSLGLDQMQLLDEDGYPNPVLGIRNQEDFQQRVLVPLYAAMGIASKDSLEARVDAVEQRLRTMTVKQANELLGYRYIETEQSRAPLRGVIAMANSGPDMNGSQFFITLADAPWLTGKHTVFGKVRAGLENADAIGKVRADATGRPLQDITILSIRRVGAGTEAPRSTQFE